MSETIIRIENISKHYRLGKVGGESFKRDLQIAWNKLISGKRAITRPEGSADYSDGAEWIWALKNVSFEIKEGDSFGIIGNNGSGKSTLLKILSRIVKPTEGRVKGKGKVCSLLEVGSGFDNELTGRENIFISGNILGMSTAEVKRKFDEIVDFSGVEQFIDTPVKRYSSGMYVRLAFAVAAHLEPDILIVDEVLAVGDAEFQKKCLGKMNETSAKQGRTVIFVSHNMQAVNNLCTKALWLDQGRIKVIGKSAHVVSNYLSSVQNREWRQHFPNTATAPGNEYIRIQLFEIVPHLNDPSDPVDIRTPLTVRYRFYNSIDQIHLAVGIHLFKTTGECIFDVSHQPILCGDGFLEGECEIPGNFLNNGSYYFSIIFVRNSSAVLYYYEKAISLEVEDFRENLNWYGDWMGVVRPAFPVSLRQNKKSIPA